MIFKQKISLLLLILLLAVKAQSQDLPVWNLALQKTVPADWLIQKIMTRAQLYKSADGKDLILYNGLAKRTFRITPNLACTSYLNLRTGQELLRSVKAEALLTINGREYGVGGLHGQHENAFILPAILDTLTAGQNDFQYVDFTIGSIKPYLNWKTRFWIPKTDPATGIRVIFRYEAAAPELKGIIVKVTYDVYDGLPLISKSVVIENQGAQDLKINRVVNEQLGMAEEEGAIGRNVILNKKPQGIDFETNYAFNDAFAYSYSDQSTHWKGDSSYVTNVGGTASPCLLQIYEDKAPGIILKPHDVFSSVKTNELLMNSYSREERGLEVRRMYAKIAPWVLANPIFMHLLSWDDESVRKAIDQCAATGYEALIISFGSDLDMEDTSKTNLQRWKVIADYAHARNIKIGSYALFSSRHISAADDVIDPKTGKPGGALFNDAACFGSNWGLGFRDKIKKFFTATGFDIWENDGPYPGDICASTTHPGHLNLDDSQWRQWQIQTELYHWLNARGIYINAPDWYFLDGTNKIAMGYREENFSLPRDQQKLLNRQNIYDATWEKTPSMGWGFVPLTEYHGGGKAATLEPLADHLPDYEQLMMQYYGAGIQACYRGPRLYDTEVTKQLVIRVIGWYKRYREILNSDIIHLRRADGQDWDGILHVNPWLETKGLVMLYNPTDKLITRIIPLPLYYTGLTTVAKISERGGNTRTYTLNRDYTVKYQITIPAKGYTWLVIK